MLRRAVRFAGAGAVAMALAAAPGARAGAPASLAAYTLRATATGARVVYEVHGSLPLERPVEGSSLFAESILERGRSTSLAVAPDPGSTVLSVPGTIDGVSGGKTDVPDYPLAARAEAPLTPEANVDAGTVHLDASAVADAASSTGSYSGADGEEINSAARSGADDTGRLVSRAVSFVSNVGVAGGAVSVGSVTSVVEIALGEDGPEVVENRTTVTDLRIAGTPVVVGDDGVIVADQPVDLGALGGLLGEQATPAGLTVRAVGPSQQQTDRGLVVMSGSLVVELPAEVQGYPTLVSFVFGQAVSAVSSVDAPAELAAPERPTRPAPSAASLFAVPSAPVAGPVPVAGAPPAVHPAVPVSAAPVVSVPTAIDFRPVYLWLAALGAAAVRLQRWVVVQSRVRRQVSDLRSLWRW